MTQGPVDVPSEGPEGVSALLHRLHDIPPNSAERNGIIRSILPYVSKVEGKDTQDFIDVIDDALDSAQMDPDLFRSCLRALRKICGLAGMLPSSHMLTTGLRKSGEVPVASGGFADIWTGSHSDNRVAIKTLRIYRGDDQKVLKQTFCKEVVIWKRLTHPNILPLIGVSTVLFPFCMVSPWMTNGNVTEYVRSNPKTDRVLLLVDVGKGLEFLHSSGIVHGDLKGANILINEYRRACLADFGLTSILSNLNSLNASTLVSHHSGTVRWMAPELLDPEVFDMPTSPNKGISTASDIYALSMVVIEIFTGNKPFQEFRNEPSVIVRVIQGKRPTRPEQSQALGLSDHLWELVEMCWHQDGSQRPTISFVLDRLESILHSSHIPPLPAVECKTPPGHTPSENSSIMTTSHKNTPKSEPYEPSIAHMKSNPILSPGFKENKVRIKSTDWPKRFLRVLFPCLNR